MHSEIHNQDTRSRENIIFPRYVYIICLYIREEEGEKCFWGRFHSCARNFSFSLVSIFLLFYIPIFFNVTSFKCPGKLGQLWNSDSEWNISFLLVFTWQKYNITCRWNVEIINMIYEKTIGWFITCAFQNTFINTIIM